MDLLIDNENLADMTPVQFTGDELLMFKGEKPEHEEALDLIRRMRLPLKPPYPDEVIFNYGAIQFLQEVWRVLETRGTRNPGRIWHRRRLALTCQIARAYGI